MKRKSIYTGKEEYNHDLNFYVQIFDAFHSQNFNMFYTSEHKHTQKLKQTL